MTALAAYATGTGQILVIEWWRRRQQHGRQLLALRWELRRVLAFDRKFNWPEDGSIPDSDLGPRPPRVSELYFKTLGDIDLTLTDELKDDNSYLSLMSVEDSCRALQETFDQLATLRPPAATASDAEKMERFLEGRSLAARYDHQLDLVHASVRDGVRDLDRRLQADKVWPQLKRAFTRLPAGANPPSVEIGDEPAPPKLGA